VKKHSYTLDDRLLIGYWINTSSEIEGIDNYQNLRTNTSGSIDRRGRQAGFLPVEAIAYYATDKMDERHIEMYQNAPVRFEKSPNPYRKKNRRVFFPSIPIGFVDRVLLISLNTYSIKQ